MVNFLRQDFGLNPFQWHITAEEPVVRENNFKKDFFSSGSTGSSRSTIYYPPSTAFQSLASQATGEIAFAIASTALLAAAPTLGIVGTTVVAASIAGLLEAGVLISFNQKSGHEINYQQIGSQVLGHVGLIAGQFLLGAGIGHGMGHIASRGIITQAQSYVLQHFLTTATIINAQFCFSENAPSKSESVFNLVLTSIGGYISYSAKGNFLRLVIANGCINFGQNLAGALIRGDTLNEETTLLILGQTAIGAATMIAGDVTHHKMQPSKTVRKPQTATTAKVKIPDDSTWHKPITPAKCNLFSKQNNAYQAGKLQTRFERLSKITVETPEHPHIELIRNERFQIDLALRAAKHEDLYISDNLTVVRHNGDCGTIELTDGILQFKPEDPKAHTVFYATEDTPFAIYAEACKLPGETSELYVGKKRFHVYTDENAFPFCIFDDDGVRHVIRNGPDDKLVLEVTHQSHPTFLAKQDDHPHAHKDAIFFKGKIYSGGEYKPVRTGDHISYYLKSHHVLLNHDGTIRFLQGPTSVRDLNNNIIILGHHEVFEMIEGHADRWVATFPQGQRVFQTSNGDINSLTAFTGVMDDTCYVGGVNMAQEGFKNIQMGKVQLLKKNNSTTHYYVWDPQKPTANKAAFNLRSQQEIQFLRPKPEGGFDIIAQPFEPIRFNKDLVEIHPERLQVDTFGCVPDVTDVMIGGHTYSAIRKPDGNIEYKKANPKSDTYYLDLSCTHPRYFKKETGDQWYVAEGRPFHLSLAERKHYIPHLAFYPVDLAINGTVKPKIGIIRVNGDPWAIHNDFSEYDTGPANLVLASRYNHETGHNDISLFALDGDRFAVRDGSYVWHKGTQKISVHVHRGRVWHADTISAKWEGFNFLGADAASGIEPANLIIFKKPSNDDEIAKPATVEECELSLDGLGKPLDAWQIAAGLWWDEPRHTGQARLIEERPESILDNTAKGTLPTLHWPKAGEILASSFVIEDGGNKHLYRFFRSSEEDPKFFVARGKEDAQALHAHIRQNLPPYLMSRLNVIDYYPAQYYDPKSPTSRRSADYATTNEQFSNHMRLYGLAADSRATWLDQVHRVILTHEAGHGLERDNTDILNLMARCAWVDNRTMTYGKNNLRETFSVMGEYVRHAPRTASRFTHGTRLVLKIADMARTLKWTGPYEVVTPEHLEGNSAIARLSGLQTAALMVFAFNMGWNEIFDEVRQYEALS